MSSISKCCKKPIINWFGKVNISFEDQDLPYTTLCMGCSKPLKENQIICKTTPKNTLKE